jgi:hypothetical protein
MSRPFLFGASRRLPEAPKYSLHRLRRRAAPRREVAGAIKKANYIGNLAMSREK